MTNTDHVDKFNEGPAAWNQWRRENSAIAPKISGGSLNWKLGAEVEQYDLAGVTLAGGDLPDALESVSFRGALLQNVDFTGKAINANFSRATLSDVILDDAFLWRCNFSGAVLQSCSFKGAKFAETSEKKHFLQKQKVLQSAKFENVHVSDCDFRQASFSKISLWRNQFVNCDFRGTTGVVLDDNVLRNSLFSPYAGDDWSVLRRHYTGANMVFLLLASLIFFLPWALDAAYWANLGRFENTLAEKIAHAEAVVEQAELGERVKTSMQAFSERLVDANVRACVEDAPNAKKAEFDQCRPVWQILLGWHEEGVWAALISGFLLLFNGLRLGLTWLIAPLRDEERRSSHTPPRRIPTRAQNDNGLVVDIRRYYGWMVWLHYLLLGMFPIAMILGLINLIPRLFDRVWVF